MVFVKPSPEMVDCGDRILKVHANLACALRHLRYERLPRVMWIDAICINQDDVDERGQQVQRMADIYRQASRVVVWLGPEGSNSDLAISTLTYLSQQVEITKDAFVVPTPEPAHPDWYDSRTELPYNSRTWEAITHLAERDWFKRLWVVQEIRLANHRAVLVCGDSSILWAHFRRSIVALIGRRGLEVSQHNVLYKLQSLCIGSSNLSISGVIEANFNRHCKDPRDKIYGVLGILPPDFASAIVPQYSLSPLQVFQDLWLTHMSYAKRLEFFRYCRLSVDRTAKNFPSWIFDTSEVLTRLPVSQFSAGYSCALPAFSPRPRWK